MLLLILLDEKQVKLEWNTTLKLIIVNNVSFNKSSR